MINQILLLDLILLIAPFFPRILTPTAVSMGTALLVQNINPWTLSLIFVGGSTVAVILVRAIEGYLIEKIIAYQKRKKYTDILSREWEKMKTYINGHKRKRREQLEKKLESEQGQRILFLLAIVGFMPTIPDFLTVALLNKKLRFGYLVGAVIIGKTIQFAPVIFLGKGILKFFNI